MFLPPFPPEPDVIAPAPDAAAADPHLQAALESLPIGVLTFDHRLRLRFANGRLATVLGIPPAALAEATLLIDALEASAALPKAAVAVAMQAAVAAIAAAGAPLSSQRLEIGDARRFTLEITRLADGTWMASVEEAALRASGEASAIEQAMHDPLTRLPNRELFQRRAVAALEQATRDGAQRSPAILLLDLDRFKAVNDTLGHPAGDALLRLAAKRLRAIMRSSDVAARLGGDEFAVLILPAGEPVSLSHLARRIVDVLGRPYLIDAQQVNIGVSVGVAQAPQDGLDYRQLMRNADLALYHAKASGRGMFSFFEPQMDARAVARRALEIDLRKALALHEFELHYQPQVELGRNRIAGFEALVRWRHPGRGLVPPGDFITLAEEIGLIGALGEWVLAQACQEAMLWPADISVAVNVSPHQFADTARLVGVVRTALAASGLPGRRLEIEITESVLLRNEQSVLEALHQLRAMEVRVAMDDFGTGYSSLSQLHSFPFDKIKIDRSFVTEREDVAGQSAIMRAITALGVSLGMATIAEGVETVEQLARIRAEGCGAVQGYLFSRPVPGAEVAQLMADFAAQHPPSLADAG